MISKHEKQSMSFASVKF